MAKEEKFKIPKALGAVADLLYATREKRLAIEKQAEALKAQESALKEHLIQTLPKSEAGGVAGKVARVTVISKPVPQVNDWDKFYAHIKKTGDFELLQRRLGEGAIKERWEAGKVVPGVEVFNAVTVSINKV
jgi:hypothetical protein